MADFTTTRLSDYGGPFISFKVTCDLCGHTVHSGTRSTIDIERVGARVIERHMRQHAPGAALDLDISWSLDANCTVCPDGGRVRTDSDCKGLVCLDCGTTWTIAGTLGERADG